MAVFRRIPAPRCPMSMISRSFHWGVVSRCSQVVEKNNGVIRREIAVEQLSTETFGGYKWDDISRKFRKQLIRKRINSLIKRNERKQKSVETEMGVELLREIESRTELKRQLRRESAKQTIATSKLRVAIDCEWGEMQCAKKNVHLVRQLVKMETYNRTAKQPAKLFLTGLREGGRIHQEGYKYDKKGLNNFLFSGITPLSPVEFFSKDEIVYLSPDAPQCLTVIDPTKVYIIGGIVDLGDSVGETFEKAKEYGVMSRKLPVTDYMTLKRINFKRCILSLNQVLYILLDLYAGMEWTQTLSCHVPSRRAYMK